MQIDSARPGSRSGNWRSILRSQYGKLDFKGIFARVDYSLNLYPGFSSQRYTVECSPSRLVRELQEAQLRNKSGPSGKTIEVPSTSASMLTPSSVGGKV